MFRRVAVPLDRSNAAVILRGKLRGPVIFSCVIVWRGHVVFLAKISCVQLDNRRSIWKLAEGGNMAIIAPGIWSPRTSLDHAIDHNEISFERCVAYLCQRRLSV